MGDFTEFDSEPMGEPFYKTKWFIATAICVPIIIIITVLLVVLIPKNKSEIDTSLRCLCRDSNGAMSKNCYGAWFYKTNIHPAEYNAKWASDHKYNFVFLTTNADYDSGKKLFKENSQAFASYNISYHAMTLEDTKFIDDHSAAKTKIRNILEYAKSENLPISGIHIDSEPHAHPDYGSKPKEVFKKYVQLIDEIRPIINEYPGIFFSAAVAWWYPSNTESGKIEEGRGFDLVNDRRLHMVVPMIYDGAGNTTDMVISRAQGYLNDGVPECVGIAYTDHGPDILKAADTIVNGILANNTNAANFYGISVYSNHHYDDWEASA